MAQKFLFINYSLNNKYNNFNRLVSLSSGVVSDKAPFYYLCVSSGLLGDQRVKGLRRYNWPVERGCGSDTLTDLRGGGVGAFIFNNLGSIPLRSSGSGHSSYEIPPTRIHSLYQVRTQTGLLPCKNSFNFFSGSRA